MRFTTKSFLLVVATELPDMMPRSLRELFACQLQLVVCLYSTLVF